MIINLEFDSASQAAPASFRQAVQQAATILQSEFTNNVTININVEYNENNISAGGAEGGPNGGLYESYQSVYNALTNENALGSADLPNASSIQGASQVAVWDAELKALGLGSTTDATDGTVDFSNAIPTSSLVGVALHELAHAMGRIPFGDSSGDPDIFDFYRYTSPGTRLFANNNPSAAAYFSLDGGNTTLAQYGLHSDPSDFLNSYSVGGDPASKYTPEDPFNQYYDNATSQSLSAVDLIQMSALGFKLKQPVYQANDFNGQQSSDFLWRNAATGDTGVWTPNGSGGYNFVDFGNVGSSWSVAGTGDFNGDGSADVLWRNSATGAVEVWNSATASLTVAPQNLGTVGLNWQIQGIDDFNGDGKADVLWRDSSTGDVALWNSNPGSESFSLQDLGVVGTNWQAVGTGDFNTDGKADILWRNSSTGDYVLWNSASSSETFSAKDLGVVGANWQVAGVADFQGNGATDILWRNTATGDVTIWNATGGGGSESFSAVDLGVVSTQWQVVGVGDYNGDGEASILWENTQTNQLGLWLSTPGSPESFSWRALGSAPAGWTLNGGANSLVQGDDLNGTSGGSPTLAGELDTLNNGGSRSTLGGALDTLTPGGGSSTLGGQLDTLGYGESGSTIGGMLDTLTPASHSSTLAGQQDILGYGESGSTVGGMLDTLDYGGTGAPLGGALDSLTSGGVGTSGLSLHGVHSV